MSIITTGIFLVYLLSTDPIPSLRAIEQFSSVEDCQATLERLTKEESNEPEEDQIHKRLKCISLSYKSEDEPPNKSPANLPSKPSYECRDRITHRLKPCLEA